MLLPAEDGKWAQSYLRDCMKFLLTSEGVHVLLNARSVSLSSKCPSISTKVFDAHYLLCLRHGFTIVAQDGLKLPLLWTQPPEN